ncbi:LytR C-terminal domain-containing protein [Kineosporia succinea]|uniref:LytR/CpsA/Psr regulator C-terminal domain-containing protein n=1 Tax=Kineosporia succinea TaxID=84632 RepID=A0ABT9P0Q8_9ACTN|nr:LytR C-terminal domain-containing protein [Kineosporia succinea]MDP9826097.1 hypothetical protein [Kineosporia succinea]
MESSTTVPTGPDRVRRRRRRQALTFAGLFLLVLLTGVGALGNSLGWYTLGSPGARVPCPAQTVSLPGQTAVNVYNGTERRGLARAVSQELKQRGFRVVQVANAPGGAQKAAVTVRYGVGDEIEARTVARQFPGRAELLRDPGTRRDHSVDVVVGSRYQAMRGRAESASVIAPVPTPRNCVTETASADGAATPG